MNTDSAKLLERVSSYTYELPKTAKDATSLGHRSLSERVVSAFQFAQAKEKLAKLQFHTLAGSMKTAVIRHADQLRYTTEAKHFVVDLRKVNGASETLYKKTLSKVGAHLHREFHECDTDYERTKSAEQAVEKRLSSEHQYETTYVTYRLKTNRLTGKTSPGVVSTIGLRQFDNPAYPKYGAGWAGDFVTADRFRGQGHGKRLAAVAAVEAHRHTALDGKVRLYAEDHNVEMYKSVGAEVAGTEFSKDDKGKDLTLTIMTMPTDGAQEMLDKLDVQAAKTAT